MSLAVKSHLYRSITISIFALLVLAAWRPVHAAQVSTAYQKQVGYLDLKKSLGGALPTGQGITVTHVEDLKDGKFYVPHVNHPEFSNTVFSFKSGVTGPSDHATRVGQYLYGNATSMSPDIKFVDNWETTDWGSSFLHQGSQKEPEIEQNRIQNHSWRKGSFISEAVETDLIRRFDYVVQRDNVVAVVGTSNSPTAQLPALFAHNYNGISVGRSDGGHSFGFTREDGKGRIKPDLVAPLGVVSHSAPVVASAAALLLETADKDASLAKARNSETVKAILMAGATKSEFPSWDRTATRPLDNRFGAGELNVDRSFDILMGGEQNPSNSKLVRGNGWDFGKTGGSPLNYFFEVPANSVLGEFSAILTWNRIITDGIAGAGWGNPESFLANLDLKLFKVNGFTLSKVLDQSVSNVDNVEHIYAKNVPAGRYALQITSKVADIDFALAWYSGGSKVTATAAGASVPQLFAVPEPSTWLLAVIGGLGLFVFPRRRRRPSL